MHSITRVKSVVDRAFVGRTRLRAIAREADPVQTIVRERRHFAAPVGKLDQVAVSVVAVRLAHSPRERSITLHILQGVFARLRPVHVVVGVLCYVVIRICHGEEISIRVVAERR